MFGIAVARLDQVSEQDKERYQHLYCGLCHTLGERYGQVPRATLSYDLTFLAMLLGALDECPEEVGQMRCPANPVKSVPYVANAHMPYAADLSVALAYHKCLDDIHDEGTFKARAAGALLKGHYQQARARIPRECALIEQSMARIVRIEEDPSSASDDAAEEFGALLGELFAHGGGFWEPHLRTLGQAVGRLVYLMDAAVDLPEDVASGAYNPLSEAQMTPDDMRCMLGELAFAVAVAFERLPIERDLELLQSVIYSGIWQKFNHVYSNA